jgi:hypothetical protein
VDLGIDDGHRENSSVAVRIRSRMRLADVMRAPILHVLHR